MHEEMDWCSMSMGTDGPIGDHNANAKYYSKRHSMFRDDAN